MKNWWTMLGCLLTGWNFDILLICTEASRKQLKKYSSALLILMILWGLVGYLFAERYVSAPWWGCSIMAIAMIVIVLQIERQIILTVGRNWLLAVFRVIIALIMAVIGSVILDQMIFKDDIEKKMIEIVDRQVTEQLPRRLTVIDTKLVEIQTEVDSLNRKNLELYAEIALRPTIEVVSTTTTPMTIRRADGTDTIVYRTAIAKNPRANPRGQEVEANNKHLDELVRQKEDYTRERMNKEESLREELGSKQGFLEELNAIFEILGERLVALIFYLTLFMFLMSLELFVVFSKFGDDKSDYDLVVEYQLGQKKKMIEQLKE
jgi:hypothetical protein